MGFSRNEYWSGLPFPPVGDLPNPGIELSSLMSPALTGRFFTSSAYLGSPIKHGKEKVKENPSDLRIRQFGFFYFLDKTQKAVIKTGKKLNFIKI